MDAFPWDKYYETGLDDVDEQHLGLVALINRFSDLLMSSDGASVAELATVFNELRAYAAQHFQLEEGFMRRWGVSQVHMSLHMAEHERFAAEIARLFAEVSADNLHPALHLLHFLTTWLAYHILDIDQSLARQIAAIRAGQSGELAYLAEENRPHKATRPLLAALHGLLREVGVRNRELDALNRSLEARVEERTRELRSTVLRLEEEKQESLRLGIELRLANRQLETLAMTDVLTELPNRRYALSRLAAEWSEATQDNTPLSCMLVDIDGFKLANDSFGHDVGDLLLREAARQMKHAVRTDDVVCRLGGDEFLVICPRTPLSGALHLAELIRQAVAGMHVPIQGKEWLCSASIGVAARGPESRDAEDLIKAADRALYAAKSQGRNRVASGV